LSKVSAEASTGPADSPEDNVGHRAAIDQDITVVIPTLGRPIIGRCLESIAAGNLWPREIIVIDQGNSKDVLESLQTLQCRGLSCRHVVMQGTGRAAGLNHGLAMVTTRFILVTDDDCEVATDWLKAMAEHLRSDVMGDKATIARKPGLTYDRLSGGNCGFAIEVLRSVGLFDEDPCMSVAEDGEWAYRALRRGVAIAFVPEAVVSHLGWRNLGERLGQYHHYARSHAAFFGKYLRRGDPFIALRMIVHLARSSLRWIRGMVRRDKELAANGRAYVTQLFPGLIAGFKSRAKPPSLP
jgi:GT2 family glycosyltransferase